MRRLKRSVFGAIPLLVAAGLIGAVLLFADCATGSRPAVQGGRAVTETQRAQPEPDAAARLTAEEALLRAPGLNAFARENLGSFRHYLLANGIPLVFKKNEASPLFALKIIVRGQALFTPPEKAGLEAVTLELLTKGSRAYPFDEVKRLLYERSSRLDARTASPDVTSFGLETLSKYLPELLPLFVDSFLHPRWDAEQFQAVVNDFKLAKRRHENDPEQRARLLLEKNLFVGHPYYASSEGIDDSLAHISLADVKGYYKEMARPGRLLIVAVGDFDSRRLVQMLNATIGQIAAEPRVAVGTPPPLSRNIHDGIITEPFPDARGLAYMLGAFSLPAPQAADYPATLIALGMLDDLLYDSVRTRRGAAYGASVGNYGLKANYGTISIYKTSRPGEVKQYVDEAIGILASGRCLAARIESSAAGKSGIGAPREGRAQAGSYVPIAEALQFYKDQYLTGFYGGQATNASIASQMAYSLVYHDDYRDYLLLTDRFAAVTASEVAGAARRYLTAAPMIWVALGDPGLLEKIDPSAYSRQGAGPAAE